MSQNPDLNTQPGMRKTFLKIARGVYDKRCQAERRSPSWLEAAKRKGGILKMALALTALAAAIFYIAPLLLEGCSFGRNRAELASPEKLKESQELGRSLFSSFKSDHAQFMKLCEKLDKASLQSLVSDFRRIESPDFENAVLCPERSSGEGLYSMELPFNGGSMRLLFKEGDGKLSLAGSSGANMY